MKINSLLLVFLFSVFKTFSQNYFPIGNWRDHLPYSQFKELVKIDDIFYASTPYSLLEYNKETNEIIVAHPGLGNGTENIEIKISRDNGQTWVNPYSPAIEDFESHPNYTYGSTSGGIVPYISNSTLAPPNIFSGNDLFAAFNIYTAGQDISNISSAFSVHDWIFESTSYGYTSIPTDYEDSRKFTSSLLVTHTNESAKITRLKGYSV